MKAYEVFHALRDKGVLLSYTEHQRQWLDTLDKMEPKQAWDFYTRRSGKTTHTLCELLAFCSENTGKSVAYQASNVELGKIHLMRLREWAKILNITLPVIVSLGPMSSTKGYNRIFTDMS